MKATVATENKNMMWNANQMVAFMEANRPNLKNTYKMFKALQSDERVDEVLFGMVFYQIFDKVSAQYNEGVDKMRAEGAEEMEYLSEEDFVMDFSRAWDKYCENVQNIMGSLEWMEREIMKMYGVEK